MPDPCRDHPRPLSDKLTGKEQDRLDALAEPFPLKIFTYLAWLCEAMPETTGTLLWAILVLGGASLLATTIVWLIILAMTGWAWIPALLGGILLATVARIILRDAAATELHARQNIAEKQRREAEKGAAMNVHHIGWQSDEPRAALVTVFHRILFGHGVVVSKLFRKFPSGHTDLTRPVLTTIVLVANEDAADRLHQTTFAALRNNTLDKDVLDALWSHSDETNPFEGFERIKTTPN
jgi:hypothetical protein